MSSLALLNTLRLASQALPIGGYSYSQGMEAAIELKWLRNEAEVTQWLQELLCLNMGHFEAPLTARMIAALNEDDWTQAQRLNQRFLAARETRELRAETEQMGSSLLQMLLGLPDLEPALRERIALLRAERVPVCLPYAWAIAGRVFKMDAQQALSAYLWTWCENQVMAAMKAMPLGQQAGQRILAATLPLVARVCEHAWQLEEDDWCNLAPGFAYASAWHETQYSRLFRS